MTTFYRTLPRGDDFSVLAEDDGKVAYAYLLHDKNIVSDLWLYNQAPTPESPEWRDRARMPFLNPRNFVIEEKMASPITENDIIKIETKLNEDGELEVELYITGNLYGLLKAGAKPGWNIAAEGWPSGKETV